MRCSLQDEDKAWAVRKSVLSLIFGVSGGAICSANADDDWRSVVEASDRIGWMGQLSKVGLNLRSERSGEGEV